MLVGHSGSGKTTLVEALALTAGAASRLPYLGGEFSLDAIEKEHIMRVLARTQTLEEAAAILGIDASTLWRKRKKYEECGPVPSKTEGFVPSG